jgi:hypothetical protein
MEAFCNPSRKRPFMSAICQIPDCSAFYPLAVVHPAAGHYLEATVRTDTACAFLLDPRFPVNRTVLPRG